MSNATTTTTKKPTPPVPGEEGATRAPGAKPQLLSQLPPSTFASPGIIAGLIAIECLYALVLFAVMSSIKRERILAWGPEPVEVPRVEPAFVPRVVAAVDSKAGREPGTKDKSSATGSAKKAERDDRKKANEAGKVPSETVAQNTEKAPAKKPKKPANRRKKANGKDQTEVALKTKPVEEPPPPPKDIPTIPPLGFLIDPMHRTQVSTNGDELTIKVPKGLYIFDAKSKIETAPRALTTVEGDFLAEVSIPGELHSPTEPLKGFGFTFQGAGLLLWQDKDNYIRFERAAAYAGERLHKVMAESCKDGKQNKTEFRNVREGAVRLRLERRGDRLLYSYSLDGKTWLKLPSSNINLPARLSIGISASNASPKDFSARFESFLLKPSGKSG